ncbi:effector-associated constant component EACC1 [Actinomadura decatromicini]|uniref:Uncharacterized protein n=1 Tax=Actinomadura decatromicini TaxID=2604572 RepID=A0A5D3G0U3_9ACTN|nr:hypothetical protein [Actinomadura decatromicini]TYK53115.1 hypothetical protein FXF68_05145 [Actinomadura decatromicini]
MGLNVEVLIGVVTDGDAEELDSLRSELSEELALLDVDALEPVVEGKAPPGTRGLEAAAVGQLLVKAGPGMVLPIVRAVRGWLRRSRARSVELSIAGDSIKLSNISLEEQERLLEIFLAKHGTG